MKKLTDNVMNIEKGDIVKIKKFDKVPDTWTTDMKYLNGRVIRVTNEAIIIERDFAIDRSHIEFVLGKANEESIVNVEITEEIAKQMYESGIESLKQFAKLNFPETCKEVGTWGGLDEISGVYVTSQSLIKGCNAATVPENRNIYPTEWEAEAFGIIYPMLAQVRDRMNGMSLLDWVKNNSSYAIILTQNGLTVEKVKDNIYEWNFIYEETANQFLNSNRELLNKYYNIKE